VAALIAIDGPAVNAWAERRGTSVTTYHELSQHPDVQKLILSAVADANAHLPSSLQVQRFVILDRELSPDTGELTRLRTVRRAVTVGRWSRLVDTLYGTSAGEDTGPSIVAVQREAAAVG
jgi:long-chain acyl-CoA synthetase